MSMYIYTLEVCFVLIPVSLLHGYVTYLNSFTCIFIVTLNRESISMSAYLAHTSFILLSLNRGWMH